jgi:acetylornithine deacetylase
VNNLTRVEARALQAVDVDATVDLLADLLAVPSIGGSDAESEIQHTLAKKLDRLDLDVDLWPLSLDELARTPGFPGAEVGRTEAWGLVATWPGETPEPGLILQGHVDVVPPGDLTKWSGAPFRPAITMDRIHGRGACDMKAGVAANLAAVAAIKKAGIGLRDTVAMHFVIGEEDGGLGAFATLQRGHTGRACIITEPTSGTVTTANAGALTFTIEVPGRATHASTSYAGSSAIDSYLAIHRALHDLQERRNAIVEPLMREYPIPYPISVGRLRAGDWSSSVPDLLVAEGRMGVRVAEDPAHARAELEEIVRTVSENDPYLRDHPPRVTWSGGQFSGGCLPPGHPLRDLVGDAHADATLTTRPRERGAPYGSDLRLYQAAGIPTLHYGPGDVRLAHGPDESVRISELLAVTRTLVLGILRSESGHTPVASSRGAT